MTDIRQLLPTNYYEAILAGNTPSIANPFATMLDIGSVAAYTINGLAISTNPTLQLASSDFINQGTTTTVLHGNAAGNPSFSKIVEADITLSNNITNDASISRHGFLPILSNIATQFLNGVGNWTVPPGLVPVDSPVFTTKITTPNITGVAGAVGITVVTNNTASGALAQGINFTPTLIASANSDVLVGLDINPTFIGGAFTNVLYVAARFISGNVGIGTLLPTSQLTQQSIAANESATLGIERLATYTISTPADWTQSPTGTFTHNGNATTITNNYTIVTATKYQLSFTITGNTVGTVTVGYGGISKVSTAGSNITYTFGGTTTSAAGFVITPTATFDGAISAISLKIITGGSTPTYAIFDNTGVSNFEIRSSLNTLNNTSVGKNAGQNNTTGSNNTNNGVNAGQNNTTGIYNTNIGVSAGQNNTTGIYNTNIGVSAGQNNTTGIYNTNIGVNAGQNNTTGTNNTNNGAGAGQNNTTGIYNTNIGVSAGQNNTTGSNNTNNGFSAGKNNTTGSSNTNIGVSAGQNNTTGSNNTNNGFSAGKNNTTGSNNTNNGINAGANNTIGSNNTNNGINAGQNNTTGNNNTNNGAAAGRYELGSNSFYVNNIDQVNTAGDKAYSLLYGTFAGTAGTKVGNTLKINGMFTADHLIGGTAAPTGAVGTGAGTSPSAVTFGTGSTDMGGNIQVTTGTLPTGGGILFTITFATAYGVAPSSVILTPANAATALLSGATMVYVSSTGTGTFVVTTEATGVPATTALSFYYQVIQ